MTFGSHINRAMCVDYSSAFLFVYASVVAVLFRRGGFFARAEEVFAHATNATSSPSFSPSISSSMRRPMATPADIPEAAASFHELNPTYEERCFDTGGDGKPPYCWYCDPTRCAETKNYENPDLANKEWCPDDACNGYKDAEKWKGYDFGCGLERNWCETGEGWETIPQCRQKYSRTEINCNCDPENPVPCPSSPDEPSPPPSPLPPPSPPPVSTSNTNDDVDEEGEENSFINVEVTTIDDDENSLFSSPPSPQTNDDASSADSGFMTPSKLGGAAVGLIGIFFLAAFVGYRNYICAKLVPRWYKNNANANATTSDEENVPPPPEWVSNKSTSKKNKSKKKKRVTTKTMST